MGLMDILAAAHGGSFFANAGQLAGIDEGASRSAIQELGPDIAERLRKTAEDEKAFDALLDLLEDGDGDAFLDDAGLIGSSEVKSDGNAILKDVYGSKAAALKAGETLTGLSKPQVERLMPVCAASVLAALARANGGSRQLASDSGGGGLLGAIVSAVIEGAVKGASRSLAPKRRRRRYSGYSTYRRRTTRRKRTRRPSLESIFRDILFKR